MTSSNAMATAPEAMPGLAIAWLASPEASGALAPA